MKIDRLNRAHYLAALRASLLKDRTTLAKKVTTVTLRTEPGYTLWFSSSAAPDKVLVDQELLTRVQAVLVGELDRVIAACEAELEQLGVELEPKKVTGFRVVDHDEPA